MVALILNENLTYMMHSNVTHKTTDVIHLRGKAKRDDAGSRNRWLLVLFAN
jgi:hypothetical protein